MHLWILCDIANRSGVCLLVKIFNVALNATFCSKHYWEEKRVEQSLDAAVGVRSLLFFSVNHSLQHLSSLTGKGKKLTHRFESGITAKHRNTLTHTKHHICCSEVCNFPSSCAGKLTKYDVTRSLFNKLYKGSPDRSVRDTKKKAALKVRYLSELSTK